jgi:soluble lytic murein transglycosylase-like protein
MVNQTTDPQKAESAKSYLLSLVPQAARIRILEEADAVAASLRAGTGLSGAYRRSTSQGANASPGMLENKAAPATTTAPVENKSLFDSLFNDSYSNVKVPTTGYFPKITEAAKAAGLRPGIAEAMVYAESGGDPNAKNSKSSATGLFQLIKGTAKEEGVDATNPDQNIKGGVAYLAKATRKAGGDPFKTAIYYHDGINKDIKKASPKAIEHARKVVSILAKYGGLTQAEMNRVIMTGKDETGKTFKLFGDGRIE